MGVSDGFNPGPKIRRMVFEEGTPFPGLWIRVGGLTLDEWLETKQVGPALELFAERLIEWNWVDDDGQPLPPNREGLGQIDALDARTLVDQWLMRAAEVEPGPLAPTEGTQPDPDIEAKIHMLPSPAASLS